MEGVRLEIIDKPILPAECQVFLSDPGHGAQVCFYGVVRDLNLGRKVHAVAYDVFEPLALKAFGEIVAAARARWGAGLRCLIVHRRGKLEVGEISVAILVGSVHRDEAYQASRYLIEEVKHRAPIWKKEFYEGGCSEWVQGHALCGHS